MKILELRFKNLNSLYGEWHIDFTDPEYAYNGIFALTGPTGAGKSTILDAICLALYGSTPRLGRITQSSNDIMSRQTGECFAEVVFQSQAACYRCTWSHHRSRKKADGDLQIPKHEISEANSEGKIIENQLKSVLGAVEEKTGMDFDRFTRSILLAQGGFDTFLKASVEQKSKILEQITGTKIYSDISIGVHERLRQERAILSDLEAETRGILILSPEEEQAIEEKLKISQLQERSLATLVTDLSKAITWLNGIAQLENELKGLTEQEQVLANDALAFASDRIALDFAGKAATLEGSFATLSEMRKQQRIESSSLEHEESELPSLVSAMQAGSEALCKAEERTKVAKEAQKDAVPTLRQVRSLDQSLSLMQSTLTQSKAAIASERASIESSKTARDREAKRVTSEQNTLLLVEAYLKGHAQDVGLVTELTGISEQIQTLSSQQKDVGTKHTEVKKAAKALKGAEETLATCMKHSITLLARQEKANSSLQDKKAELTVLLGGKLLREYRSEKEALFREREFLARIAALEEHRNHLVEGKACPLCGSLEHPFALGDVPTSDETEKKIEVLDQMIGEAESLETKIVHLAQAERDASTELTEQKKLESDAQHSKESAQAAHLLSLEAYDNAQKLFAAMEEGVASKLKAYGMEEIPGDLSALLLALRQRKDAWLKKEEEKRTLENTIGSLKGEMQRLNGIIDTKELALQEKQATTGLLADAYALARQDRLTLYGEKDADVQEESLGSAVNSAERAEKLAGKDSSDLSQKVTAAKVRIDGLQTSLAQRKPMLKTNESLFLEELSSVGFSDEQQFLNARLALSERNRLALQAKSLDERQTELKANVKDRTTRLGIEQAKLLTDKPLSDLQPLVEEKEGELKEAREAVAGHRARLRGNGEAKQRMESRLGGIERQKKECAKWDRLHSLVGSADGKKFRNFAQGLTFELMVGHANRQLEKMSDRYLLIRDDGQPLELNVIDNYQAGEIRSTKNLSGGESFIVSLTLALGLSKMASRKVRVDSLFLDEGFGTLDEASLETALKTLSSLQQDGKLIGVISHVSAMQEMISTQIVITPASGGRSLLSGPGCSRVQ